jgi:hypothetical protein
MRCKQQLMQALTHQVVGGKPGSTIGIKASKLKQAGAEKAHAQGRSM